jgi:prepilin-type N-terminal cleavage/methylation domain-containing protein
MQTQAAGNRSAAACDPGGRPDQSQKGFTLVEAMMAMVILLGSFVMLTSALPIASVVHRTTQERQVALSLAQAEMEYLLTNPGPAAGTSGNQSLFFNQSDFPARYTGRYEGQAFSGGGGLTLIIVSVTPPHGPRVELSAIDTNLGP